MIPLVGKGLVDLVKQGQTTMKSAPHIRFGEWMSTGRDALGHTLHGVVFGGEFDEMEMDAVCPGPPEAHPSGVHPRRQSGLYGEGGSHTFSLVKSAQKLPARGNVMSKGWISALNLVHVQEWDGWKENRQNLPSKRRLSRAVCTSYDNCLGHSMTLRCIQSYRFGSICGELIYRPEEVAVRRHAMVGQSLR
jgi:hypothetical protein